MIKKDLPRFKNAEIFFNNRQTAGSHTALVRSANGLNVYRVRVADTGARKVTVIEQVK